jgi:hypothetical protein
VHRKPQPASSASEGQPMRVLQATRCSPSSTVTTPRGMQDFRIPIDSRRPSQTRRERTLCSAAPATLVAIPASGRYPRLQGSASNRASLPGLPLASVSAALTPVGKNWKRAVLRITNPNPQDLRKKRTRSTDRPGQPAEQPGEWFSRRRLLEPVCLAKGRSWPQCIRLFRGALTAQTCC